MTTVPANRPHRHSTLTRTTAITWLVLISGIVLIDHVSLSRVSELAETSASDIRVAVLDAQLDELSQHLEQNLQQPVALSQARYETERQALEGRLTAIEQALADGSAVANLSPLQARIERLEARQAATRPATQPVTRSRPPAVSRPMVTESPFKVVGAELRAGERFLSILPSGAGALSQIRLLRPGETEAGWLLEAIEETSAVFRHGNDTRRLAVPRQ